MIAAMFEFIGGTLSLFFGLSSPLLIGATSIAVTVAIVVFVSFILAAIFEQRRRKRASRSTRRARHRRHTAPVVE
jgi:peptidoglycan/LPS O-acetylase OafA/YrhL